VLSGAQKGNQVLKEETEMGFNLLRTLTETQLRKIIIDTIAFNN